MQIRFWGTRGSIAKPGPTTLRYGGNTSCVELRSDAGTLVVFDCGTGAHALGQSLVEEFGGPTRGHLLIGHTHWDHIQGIPFFAPFFVKGSEWDVYGPKGLHQSMREALAGQMEHTYFPITPEEFGATIRYHDLVEGSFSIADLRVAARYLNHPALTLGYRVQGDGTSVVYSCDHEPHVAAAASGTTEITAHDRRHVEFLENADLVIHDAQYVAGDFPGKIGWGHSSAEYVIRVCREARAKAVALTHHDPERNDDAIDRIVERLREQARRQGDAPEIFAAAEGQVVHLSPHGDARGEDSQSLFPAQTAIDDASLMRPLLLDVPDLEMRTLLQEAAQLENLPVPAILENNQMLRGISAARYSLVILQHAPPAIDALAVARAIRSQENPDDVQLPIAIVTTDEDLSRRAGDDATDWLIAPFSLSYARTKIRSWTLRVAARWLRARKPANEKLRLERLHDLSLLDTPPEERFDRITRLAAAVFDTPIALVSLIDRDRQWFKSCIGLDIRETSRELAFCAHAVREGRDIVVPDTLLDDRFADNPLVRESPRIRFYAGAPLILEDGYCMGTLCILDRRPRNLSAADLAALHDLRDMVIEQLSITSAVA
jgi:phosphoribosyl 1,2-cyclic phosphodiesterase/CheY-like chemotaxis protein